MFCERSFGQAVCLFILFLWDLHKRSQEFLAHIASNHTQVCFHTNSWGSSQVMLDPPASSPRRFTEVLVRLSLWGCRSCCRPPWSFSSFSYSWWGHGGRCLLCVTCPWVLNLWLKYSYQYIHTLALSHTLYARLFLFLSNVIIFFFKKKCISLFWRHRLIGECPIL